MKKFAVSLFLLSLGLFLIAHPGRAQTISGTTTSEQKMTATGTLTVTGSGSLLVGGGSPAVYFNDSTNGQTLTVINNGLIEQNGTGSNAGNAMLDNKGHTTLLITNTGTITTVQDDVIHLSQASNNVTISNYGLISSQNTTNGSNQAININGITSGQNIIYNYAGAEIYANNSDAVRPGVSGTVINSGTILSTQTASLGGSNDGIDAQNNSGITILNGDTTITGTSGANLIEGGRHGITGGQDVDTADSKYNQAFVMTISNSAGSTIQGDNGSGINIDGVSALEQVTIVNNGLISGDATSLTGTGASMETSHDGDGVDVDGVVYITNTGTIISRNSINDSSEGITVGGGTIFNSGTIEGSVVNTSGTNTALGRGITLAGVDNTTTNGVKSSTTIQQIYANTSVTNSGGLIKGDSDAGIAMEGIVNTSGTVFSISITNTMGGIIQGSGRSAVIDGSASVASGTTTIGTASPYNETVDDTGTIEYMTLTGTPSTSGTAISLGTGTNLVTIRGGSATIIGDMSGGSLTGTNTIHADLQITPGSGNSFSYNGNISNFSSIEIGDGTTNFSGTVTFSNANSYNGYTTLSISGTTSAELDLSGAGTINNTGTLSVGSNGILNLGGKTINVNTLLDTNGGMIDNGTVTTSGTNSSTINGLSGSTSYNKTGSGTTYITGTNTYTGGTTVSAGKLSVNGSITGSVTVNAGAQLGGSGLISGAITGTGNVGPGNSPGILTASSVNTMNGLSFSFEMTQAGTATWSNATASGNDVLHLTAATPFSAPLNSTNDINVYFSSLNLTYDAGFFTDGSTNDLTSNIANATYFYYILDNTNGTVSYNGNLYDVLSASQVTASVIQITGADFGTGTVNGWTEQFAVAAVPEPSTYALLAIGTVVLILAARRRNSANQ